MPEASAHGIPSFVAASRDDCSLTPRVWFETTGKDSAVAVYVPAVLLFTKGFIVKLFVEEPQSIYLEYTYVQT